MNAGHSKLTDWGLSHVSIEKNETILDVGCGGGRTISKLAQIATDGKIYGIDFSPESVATARKVNARLTQMGQVEIREGSVSQLPFGDDTFDLVTAVETHFFWPDLPGDMREVLRVLRPNGTLILVAEIYKGATNLHGKLAEKFLPSTGMTLLTSEEHRELFTGAGFSGVQVIEERDKGWICALGTKKFRT